MKIAIYGAGSLGTILGAYITKAGYKIHLIDSYEKHINALNESGARIIGHVEFLQDVEARLPKDMDSDYDLILYMVKQTSNHESLNYLKDKLSEEGIICTLQNGIPEPELLDFFGRDRIMGCTVGWGATWIEPGVSEVTTKEEVWEFDLGRYNGIIDSKVMEVKKILESMCKTVVTENLMGVRWGKLLMNTTFSGMSAALGCTFGELLDDMRAIECIQNLANETITICRAENIEMEIVSSGVDFDKELSFKNTEERINTIPVYYKVWGNHRASKASMLQDLEKGRKSEIDAINGVVSRLGKQHDIKTPYNDKVVEIVQGIENKTYELTFENIERFKKR